MRNVRFSRQPIRSEPFPEIRWIRRIPDAFRGAFFTKLKLLAFCPRRSLTTVSAWQPSQALIHVLHDMTSPAMFGFKPADAFTFASR